MAEAAAVAYGTLEAVETTAQVGVGAYMLTKPTLPLKATFTQIATSSDDDTRLSLARSDHTVSVVGTKAYIFGGETASGKLAGNEIHIINLEATSSNTDPDYSVIAAVSATDAGRVPPARTQHAACVFDECIAVYGGVDDTGKTLDDAGAIWLYNTNNRSWDALEASAPQPAPPARRAARLFADKDSLLLYGGIDAGGAALTDLWAFHRTSKTWAALPSAPVSTSNAVLADGALYLVAPGDNVASDVHSFPLSAPSGANGDGGVVDKRVWSTTPFPTNPLTPGPHPRVHAGLHHISTGYGRNYLAYLLGMHPPSLPEPSTAPLQPTAPPSSDTTSEAPSSSHPVVQQPLYHSDTWVYQLASSAPEAKATTHVYDALKPAALKDSIRGALGLDSGRHRWAEADIVVPADDLPDVAPATGAPGKVHPGPRARFGCDGLADGRGVVLWGGVNAKGEREGDGWVVRFS